MGEDEGDQGFVRLVFEELPLEQMHANAEAFFELMDGRRTTRHFSDRRVPRELIETAVKTASTSPSGAHLQPWTFVAISNQALKLRIRGRQRRRSENSTRKEFPKHGKRC